MTSRLWSLFALPALLLAAATADASIVGIISPEYFDGGATQAVNISFSSGLQDSFGNWLPNESLSVGNATDEFYKVLAGQQGPVPNASSSPIQINRTIENSAGDASRAVFGIGRLGPPGALTVTPGSFVSQSAPSNLPHDPAKLFVGGHVWLMHDGTTVDYTSTMSLPYSAIIPEGSYAEITMSIQTGFAEFGAFTDGNLVYPQKGLASAPNYQDPVSASTTVRLEGGPDPFEGVIQIATPSFSVPQIPDPDMPYDVLGGDDNASKPIYLTYFGDVQLTSWHFEISAKNDGGPVSFDLLGLDVVSGSDFAIPEPVSVATWLGLVAVTWLSRARQMNRTPFTDSSFLRGPGTGL